MMVNQFQYNLNSRLEQLSSLQTKMSMGRKYGHISDDPIALIYSQQANRKLKQVANYQSNVDQANNWLTTVETGIREINSIMTTAYENAVQAATDVMTASDRSNIASFIAQLRDHVLQTLNQTIGDKYVFGGYNTTGYTTTDSGKLMPPFEYDSQLQPITHYRQREEVITIAPMKVIYNGGVYSTADLENDGIVDKDTGEFLLTGAQSSGTAFEKLQAKYPHLAAYDFEKGVPTYDFPEWDPVVEPDRDLYGSFTPFDSRLQMSDEKNKGKFEAIPAVTKTVTYLEAYETIPTVKEIKFNGLSLNDKNVEPGETAFHAEMFDQASGKNVQLYYATESDGTRYVTTQQTSEPVMITVKAVQTNASGIDTPTITQPAMSPPISYKTIYSSSLDVDPDGKPLWRDADAFDIPKLKLKKDDGTLVDFEADDIAQIDLQLNGKDADATATPPTEEILGTRDTLQTSANQIYGVDENGDPVLDKNGKPIAAEIEKYDIYRNDCLALDVGVGSDMKITFNGIDVAVYGYDAEGKPKTIIGLLDTLYRELSNDGVQNADDGQYTAVDIGNLLSEFKDAQNHMLALVAEIGGRTNRLDLLESRYQSDVLNYTQMKSDAEDADEAELIMQYKLSEATYKAALSTGSYIIQPTLMDYLR
jgi:flagellin-like hook-associated protein FlgL